MGARGNCGVDRRFITHVERQRGTAISRHSCRNARRYFHDAGHGDDVFGSKDSFQAQKNFVAQVDETIDGMQKFDEEADAHLARFPNAEKRYEDITAMPPLELRGLLSTMRWLAMDSPRLRQALGIQRGAPRWNRHSRKRTWPIASRRALPGDGCLPKCQAHFAEFERSLLES